MLCDKAGAVLWEEERGTITEKWKSEEVTFLLLETRGSLPFVVHKLALCQELF